MQNIIVKLFYFFSLTAVCFTTGRVHSAPEKTAILLVFPKFENLGITDQRVIAGIRLRFNADPWINKRFSLHESNAPAGVGQLVEKLREEIRQLKPRLIIGAVTSNSAFAISEVAEAEGIPFLSPFATHPSVTTGKRFTFTTCFNDNFQAVGLAKHIWRAKKKSGLVLVNQSSSYSLGFAERFQQEFKKLGGKVKRLEFNATADVDLDAISRTAGVATDFVLIPSYQVEAARLVSMIFPRLSKNVSYFGGDSWGGGTIFHNAIKDIGAQFKGYYVQHWTKDLKSPQNLEFLKTLKNNPPPTITLENSTAMIAPIAMGYDVAAVAFEAIRNSDGGNVDKLVKAIRRSKTVGASGRIRFKENQNSPDKNLYIYEITATGERLLKALEP